MRTRKILGIRKFINRSGQINPRIRASFKIITFTATGITPGLMAENTKGCGKTIR